MPSHLKIYTAESQAKKPGQVIRDMFRGVIDAPYAAYRLCLKDVKTEYSQSVFGMLWDFADPLALGLIFYFLQRTRIINMGEISIPYAVFVVFGILIYITFVDAVLIPLTLIQRSKAMLVHLRLSPECLLMSAFFRILFNSSFRVVIMLAFAIGMDAFSWVGLLKFLLLFPTIILAGMCIGVFAAPFNVIFSDVGRAVRIILNPLRYATPVFYVIPTGFPFNYINLVNPISLVLSDLRSVATENVFVDAIGFSTRVGMFGLIFFIGWFIFHLSIPILAERA